MLQEDALSLSCSLNYTGTQPGKPGACPQLHRASIHDLHGRTGAAHY